MSVVPGTGKVGSSAYIGRVKYARADYDFAVDGGAIGAITLRGDTVPAGALVVDSIVNVETALAPTTTSTISIGVEGAADIRAAAVATGTVVLSTATPKRGVITGATAPVKTTEAQPIVATIAAGAFTAGKFSVILAYIELV